VAPRVPRWHGRKPRYEVNPSHVPGPTLRPGKTPLPADAETVYRHAVPDPVACSAGNHAWYGRNAAGEFYRYQGRNAVHWNGIVRWQDLPEDVKFRFEVQGLAPP
jgi:hypothetical protein